MKKISSAPAWLDLNENRTQFVVVPEKAQIIRRLFQETAQGIGAYSIAKRLNGERIPTIGPSPRWLPSSISKILENRAVTGEFQPMSRKGGGQRRPTGDPVQDYYPRVIEAELFAEAERARKTNIINNRGRKGTRFTNLFTGLLSCAECNARMKFVTHERSRSFGCATFARDGSCVSHRWEYEAFERALVESLTEISGFKLSGDYLHGGRDLPLGSSDDYALRAATNMSLKQLIRRIFVGAFANARDDGILQIDTVVTAETHAAGEIVMRFRVPLLS
jgi:hypothetical protein